MIIGDPSDVSIPSISFGGPIEVELEMNGRWHLPSIRVEVFSVVCRRGGLISRSLRFHQVIIYFSNGGAWNSLEFHLVRDMASSRCLWKSFQVLLGGFCLLLKII